MIFDEDKEEYYKPLEAFDKNVQSCGTGVDILDNVSFILAFSAGLLSFLSPCVLPLVPAYIGYLTGSAVAEINTGKAKLYLFYKSAGFVLGFSLIFIIMGVSISSLGMLLAENQVLFKRIGGILIILFGIHTTGLIKIRWLYSEKRLLSSVKGTRSIGSVFIGMAFAAGWTPCVGPILASILIVAGSMDTLWSGVFLLVLYSLGLAVPFMLLALIVGNISGYMKKISKHLPVISIISGVLLIIMGILVFTDKMTILSRYFNFINV